MTTDVSENAHLTYLSCWGNEGLIALDVSNSPSLVKCIIDGVETFENGYYTYAVEESVLEVGPDVQLTPTPTVEGSNFTIVNGVVTAYNGAGGAVEIPAQNGDGNAVTAIGEAAFKANATITSVSIPTSVASVGASAFEECSALESVAIPNGVSVIGVAAFKNCEKLKSMSAFG